MALSRNDVGAGVVAIAARPYVDEPTSYVSQLWATRRMGESLKLSGILAFDTDAAAGGSALSWLPVRTSWLTLGVEGELGYAWAAMGVPLAIHLPRRGVALYSTPRLGTWGDSLTPALPIGMSVRVYRGWAIRAEAQVSWADFKYYNRRLQLGLALSYQFGATTGEATSK